MTDNPTIPNQILDSVTAYVWLVEFADSKGIHERLVTTKDTQDAKLLAHAGFWWGMDRDAKVVQVRRATEADVDRLYPDTEDE